MSAMTSETTVRRRKAYGRDRLLVAPDELVVPGEEHRPGRDRVDDEQRDPQEAPRRWR